jgi:hypothetical protein
MSGQPSFLGLALFVLRVLVEGSGNFSNGAHRLMLKKKSRGPSFFDGVLGHLFSQSFQEHVPKLAHTKLGLSTKKSGTCVLNSPGLSIGGFTRLFFVRLFFWGDTGTSRNFSGARTPLLLSRSIFVTEISTLVANAIKHRVVYICQNSNKELVFQPGTHK